MDAGETELEAGKIAEVALNVPLRRGGTARAIGQGLLLMGVNTSLLRGTPSSGGEPEYEKGPARTRQPLSKLPSLNYRGPGPDGPSPR